MKEVKTIFLIPRAVGEHSQVSDQQRVVVFLDKNNECNLSNNAREKYISILKSLTIKKSS